MYHKILWKTLLLVLALFAIVAQVPTAFAETTQIVNPITATSFEQLLQTITQQIQPLAFTFAVFAVIIVGFRFVLASLSGNESKITEARKTLVWVLIGTAIAVGAYAIASAVVNFAQSL